MLRLHASALPCPRMEDSLSIYLDVFFLIEILCLLGYRLHCKYCRAKFDHCVSHILYCALILLELGAGCHFSHHIKQL